MEELVRAAQELFHVHIAGRQVVALITYERELVEWNQKFNLTAIRDTDSIRTKHFLDSFSCVQAWGERAPRSLVDVGSGAGFPGIPLKILYPDMQLTLIEAVAKKAMFCEHILKILGLQNAQVIQARVEQVGHLPEHRQKYDWAVARAVASMNVLAEYLLPLVELGGHMLAQKGGSGPAELQEAAKAIRLLGGEAEQPIGISLPDVPGERYLIPVRKVHETPSKYPRRPGLPAGKPL
jgi:16S rRNA (guanine527-N7)-methyltransferase